MHHLTYDFLFPGWWTPHPLQGSRLQRPHFSNPESTFLPFQTLSYRCPNQSGKSRFWFPWSHLWSCAVHYTCYTNTAQQPLYTRGTSWCSKMLRHNYRCISICLELSLIEVPLRRAFTDEYIPWHICFMLWLGGKKNRNTYVDSMYSNQVNICCWCCTISLPLPHLVYSHYIPVHVGKVAKSKGESKLQHI